MYSSLTSWGTWLVLSVFYAYQYAHRILLATILEDVTRKFGASPDQIGIFAGVYYFGYVGIHIPLGIMFENFNAKKVITGCILLTVIGFVPLVYGDSFTLAIVGRFFVGVGSAGAALGAFKLLRLCFGEDKFPKMLGWAVSIGLLISLFGVAPLGEFVAKLGWHKALNDVLLFGIGLAVFAYIFIPNTASEEKFDAKVVAEDFRYLFKNKMVFAISLAGGLLIGPLEGFADAWSVVYAKVLYGISDKDVGYLGTAIPFGMAIGLIVLGYIFEKLKSYYALIIISGLGMLVPFVLVMMKVFTSVTVIQALYFIIGFFCAYQIFIIAKTASIVSEKHSVFISAVTNMILMVFGPFVHGAIGMTIGKFWNGEKDSTGLPIYSQSDLTYGLSIIPITLILGILCFLYFSYREKNR